MTEQELERLLAKKEASPGRQNVSLVLSPDITRHAMRLKKRRQDRIQTVICLMAALIFLLAAAGLGFYLNSCETPERALRIILAAAGGSMGLVLLLSPALAYFSDEEKKNEA